MESHTRLLPHSKVVEGIWDATVGKESPQTAMSASNILVSWSGQQAGHPFLHKRVPFVVHTT